MYKSKVLSLLVSSLLFISCTEPTQNYFADLPQNVKQKDSNDQKTNEDDNPKAKVTDEKDDYICDPLNKPNSEDLVKKNGISAKLYSSSKEFDTVKKYINTQNEVHNNLFFKQLNIPTRMFDQGFPRQDGTPLKNQRGNPLIENFALQFKSNIELSSEQEEGYYNFAILSDDGAVLKIAKDQKNNEEVLINQDEVTPTKMGCSTRNVHLDHKTSLPIKLEYFQGPRYHIALVLMWKKSDSKAHTLDPSCGTGGAWHFFEPSKDQKGVAGERYQNLLDRGWKPVPAKNFHLEDNQINPCS